MASTITEITTLIDTGFPVPGQDNDTQGFRNNFANIKIGFERAAEEIFDLGIIQIGIANQLNNFTNPSTFNGTLVTATVVTSQSINNSGDITVTGTGRFIGDGSLLSNLNISNVNQINNLVDLTTQNLNVTLVNGFTATVYVPTAPASSKGVAGDRLGMIHATSGFVYVCYANYVSTTTNIWARLATTGANW